MKIRIKGNSLRFRLSQSEVGIMQKERMVSDSIDFGDRKLIYGMEVTDNDDISVDFNGSFITVKVPEKTLSDWVNTEEVGFTTQIPLPQGDTLKVLVEKDFQCLKAREGENEEDLYKNPMAK
ncbi:hypothetical protein LVD15_14490 [Fulvivirga maritima]|uniref:DUF7009 family protein n=1 Tax=Fulvivirga maritima TaxID=2904247 RepID=UPI001F30CE7D|nr:hypothetical protein [Fulvivirga maritima]UII24532.1 hypothetical protein LVD15_14490 [Fulvivirga maritima]